MRCSLPLQEYVEIPHTFGIPTDLQQDLQSVFDMYLYLVGVRKL